MTDCGNPIAKNLFKLRDNRKEFETRFKVPLTPFMNPLTGFDVVTFDKYLNVPDGTSTKDFIAIKYGPQAVELVEKLILA